MAWGSLELAGHPDLDNVGRMRERLASPVIDEAAALVEEPRSGLRTTASGGAARRHDPGGDGLDELATGSTTAHGAVDPHRAGRTGGVPPNAGP